MSTIASHSPLNISETVRDRGFVPNDHHQLEVANWESSGHVTDDVTWSGKVKLDLNTLRAQYLENSWSCYLVTLQQYPDIATTIVCCVAGRSAILATAWLLVLMWI